MPSKPKQVDRVNRDLVCEKRKNDPYFSKRALKIILKVSILHHLTIIVEASFKMSGIFFPLGGS